LLVYDKDRSVNPEKAGGNMIIAGEKLEVLKLLSSAYRGRIKCLCIDPPYNTGKDFVYSDRFAEGQKPYWEQTGITEDGMKVDTNTDSGGRFDSDWLSMMHSRLLVACYLLQPDGFIFLLRTLPYRATQLSVKFYRWLSLQIYDPSPWRLALGRLQIIYANY
jgi:adenine-specific DNA-methyltransferase